MTVFVKCKFRPSDTRTYTYVWDGGPLAKGDIVKVADAREPGNWKRVWVDEVTDEAPPFACKPILGLMTGEDTDSAILDAALGSDVAFFPDGAADQ